MPQTEIKIFLASSSELELERVHIGDFFNDINSILIDTETRVRLLKWEVFDPSFKGERKQTEYDHQVLKSDVFIALFRTKAGMYTREEVDVAKASHKENKMPQELYCFFQDWKEKREFEIDEIKTKFGADFTYDTFEKINDLKYKIIKILMQRFTANGISISETDKFVQINSINILRK